VQTGTPPPPITPRCPGNFVRVRCNNTLTIRDRQARGPAGSAQASSGRYKVGPESTSETDMHLSSNSGDVQHAEQTLLPCFDTTPVLGDAVLEGEVSAHPTTHLCQIRTLNPPPNFSERRTQVKAQKTSLGPWRTPRSIGVRAARSAHGALSGARAREGAKDIDPTGAS